jgi:hypothetical protein
VAHFEPAWDLGLSILNLEVIDPRVGGAAAHSVDHSADIMLIALDERFDRAIAAIADPTADAELSRLSLGPRAEEHSLHMTRDTEAARDLRHHTVEMSGASSAFMPMTL